MSGCYNMGRSASARKSDRLLCTEKEFPPFDPKPNLSTAVSMRYGSRNSARLVYRHDLEEEDPPPQPTRTSFLENVGLKQRRFFISLEYAGNAGQICNRADVRLFSFFAVLSKTSTT